MRERALLFGEQKSLVGVITDPPEPPSPERPAVVFLNAGILHRVGPNRIHVRLARDLAREGFASLRFDYSGLGDSRPRADPTPFAEATVIETTQGMDVLASTRGTRSFLLVGICSGADSALRAAGRDARVVGAALIEPYSVPAPGFLLYSYRRKLLNPVSWWRLLRGRSEVLAMLKERPMQPPGEEAAVTSADSIVPSRAELVRQVRGLIQRGVNLCFVYSSGSPAYFNYLSLLRRELRRPVATGQARLRVLTRTDHVFTPMVAQERLVTSVREWAKALVAPSAAVGA